ncbi:MAG: deoxyribodipyrimidine photo-lyase, partial [Kangiellaceae bacterium]|nr:deoxyribodipyrimidine photo-lyase [Kangiellaceae bacterium]
MNVVWLRRDFRLSNNPALYYACKNKDAQVLALYCLSIKQWSTHQVGDNQQSLILKQAIEFRKELKKLNIPLLIVKADFAQTPRTLDSVLKKLECRELFFNMEYPLDERIRDRRVVENVKHRVKVHRFATDSILPPWEIVNNSGEGYKVFTPFSKAVKFRLRDKPMFIYPQPGKLCRGNFTKGIAEIESFKFDEKLEVIDKLPLVQPTAREMPEVNCHQAKRRLENFCEMRLKSYQDTRDFPFLNSTSGVSTALAIGSISAGECY